MINLLLLMDGDLWIQLLQLKKSSGYDDSAERFFPNRDEHLVHFPTVMEFQGFLSTGGDILANFSCGSHWVYDTGVKFYTTGNVPLWNIFQTITKYQEFSFPEKLEIKKTRLKVMLHERIMESTTSELRKVQSLRKSILNRPKRINKASSLINFHCITFISPNSAIFSGLNP